MISPEIDISPISAAIIIRLFRKEAFPEAAVDYS